MTTAAQLLLAGATLLFVVRLVRGPSLADRILALDGLLVGVTAFIVVEAVRQGTETLLDPPLAVALVGFLGTAVAARFVERRGG